MNEQMDDTMRDGLRSAASGAGTPALTLDDVRGRARGIRRRRAAVGAGGAAVLVAAAVLPVALLAGDDSSPDTLPPADATPTVADTANPEVETSGAGWIVDGEVRASDGTAFTPDVAGEVGQLLRMADGLWVLGAYPDGAGGEFRVLVVDSTGTVLSTRPATEGGLVRDDAGTAVAWIDEERRPTVLVLGTGEPVTVPVALDGRAVPSPREVLPGCTVDDCQVLVEIYDGSPDGSSDVVVSLDGSTTPLDRLGLLSISDVSPDGALVSGLVTADEIEMEYCSAVVVFATGEELWRSCEAGSFRFSPAGSMVLAADPYLDGFGHSFAQVLDSSDGTSLQRFEGDTVFDERWDSEGSFLVSQQTDEGRNELLRVGPDPAEVEVVESVPGTPDDPEGIIRLGG